MVRAMLTLCIKLVTEAGIPMTRIWPSSPQRQPAHTGADGESSLERNKKNHTDNSTDPAFPRTVAMAAPAAPISSQKIKTGSSMILITEPSTEPATAALPIPLSEAGSAGLQKQRSAALPIQYIDSILPHIS